MKIKIDNAWVKTFDCIYCETEDIEIPKNIDFTQEKFYKVRCPACNKINYVIPSITIEPIPFTDEDYKSIKSDKQEIKRVVYIKAG